ncbi:MULTISPECIES: GTP cyclohydrolase FolE2 [unclassified Desulfovibrio]|uniref:GTP cyclohydrolase FolE2 n=1 Tax=unclassified Desulfovibrio TaxID=2593640 RepID=UPI0013EB2FED|nr:MULTISPECIES: GTP cyclohydrolase FolE2 [unclassified Desulfovibrio]
MEDVQNRAPEVALDIDRVGVRGLRLPLRVRDRAGGSQATVASADLGVELPSARKGTHMSRLVEAVEDWDEGLDRQSVQRLLENVRRRLDARRAWVRFAFPYFVRKSAPARGDAAPLAYDCAVTSELDDSGQVFILDLAVPVMTVCPCSKAISREGAHSQRALVRIRARISGFVWLEELIELAEAAGSSAVYTLLKREDEKFVTEQAFARPAFVEDVVRAAASALERHPRVTGFTVEVESMESIHNHNAFARIERGAPVR